MKLNTWSCKNLLHILLSPSLWFDVYWPASRKYFFGLLFIGVISAKLLHVYSHLNSLSIGRLFLWGPTFFLQDVVCILVALFLTHDFSRRWMRVLGACMAIPG